MPFGSRPYNPLGIPAFPGSSPSRPMNQWLRDPFNDKDNVDMYGQPIRDFRSTTIYNPLSPTAVSDPTSEQYGHTANPNYVPPWMMGPKPPRGYKREKSIPLVLNKKGEIISNIHERPQNRRNTELLIVTGPER